MQVSSFVITKHRYYNSDSSYTSYTCSELSDYSDSQKSYSYSYSSYYSYYSYGSYSYDYSSSSYDYDYTEYYKYNGVCTEYNYYYGYYSSYQCGMPTGVLVWWAICGLLNLLSAITICVTISTCKKRGTVAEPSRS